MLERKGRGGEVFCGYLASFIEKGRHEHRLVGRELILPLHFKTHPRISTRLSWDANPDMLEMSVCALNLPPAWQKFHNV